jgi:signal peptidase I
MADDNVQPSPAPVPPASPTAVTPNPTTDRAGTPQTQPLGAPPPASGILAAWHYLQELVWPSSAPHAHQTESLREVVETIVFVVVLVLLLKSFAAEAFVIPTGSMAETLWGYQKVVECPRCHHVFPVNCSQEVDPSSPPTTPVTGCTCPNCRFHIDFKAEFPEYYKVEKGTFPWGSGDRVLVDKGLYDLLSAPERFDVVVFKFPGDHDFPSSGPQKGHVPMNYIKRLTGKSGETIGIWYGDLYVSHADQPDETDLNTPPEQRWQKSHVHLNKLKDDLEQQKGFTIVRKSPDKILAVKRIVFDNDHPATDLPKEKRERWSDPGPEPRWELDEQTRGFRHGAHPGTQQPAWLRYTHLLRSSSKPELITDFMGYNTYEPHRGAGGPPENWVGDLILECEVTVEKPAGELTLELSKGVDRFRAHWDLASGACTLSRQTLHEPEVTLGESRPTAMKQPGTYRLRFANVDQRLTVWVDGALPFGDGVPYDAPAQRGPNPENDLQPASVGVKDGLVSVHHLKLWRDTYYTVEPGFADWDVQQHYLHMNWAEPDYTALNNLPGKTMFVQPDHYLCMGDNSPESSDGRSWGLVPERLMLGRALMVYYPFYFPWPPLYSPVNRVGPIK